MKKLLKPLDQVIKEMGFKPDGVVYSTKTFCILNDMKRYFGTEQEFKLIHYENSDELQKNYNGILYSGPINKKITYLWDSNMFVEDEFLKEEDFDI